VVAVLLLRVMRSGGGRYFRLFGAIDLPGVSELTGVVLRHIDGEGDVVLDLDEVTFLDRRGIDGFVQIARVLQPNGELTLLSPRPAVARVLAQSGIAQAVPNLIVFCTHDPAPTTMRGAAERARPTRTRTEPTVVSLESDPPPVPALCHGTSPSSGARPAQAPKPLDAQEYLPFIWLG
jgi:anti-anti-sigma factor